MYLVLVHTLIPNSTQIHVDLAQTCALPSSQPYTPTTPPYTPNPHPCPPTPHPYTPTHQPYTPNPHPYTPTNHPYTPDRKTVMYDKSVDTSASSSITKTTPRY